MAYRDSYEHWHKKIESGEHSGHLPFPLDAAGVSRTAPVPAAMRSKAWNLISCFVGDFGDESGASQLMLDHLKSADEQGLRIGLMHFPSLLHADAIDKSFSTELHGRLRRGTAPPRRGNRPGQSEIVNIYDPTAFQYSRELRSGHQAGQVDIWAGEPPYNHESDEHKYDVGAVERNAMAVFGVPVHWTAIEPDD